MVKTPAKLTEALTFDDVLLRPGHSTVMPSILTTNTSTDEVNELFLSSYPSTSAITHVLS